MKSWASVFSKRMSCGKPTGVRLPSLATMLVALVLIIGQGLPSGLSAPVRQTAYIETGLQSQQAGMLSLIVAATIPSPKLQELASNPGIFSIVGNKTAVVAAHQTAG